MRIALLILVSACTTHTITEVPELSLRERLATPTRLLVGAGSAGAVEARRWEPDGWHAALAPLHVTTGELTAMLVDDRLVISDLDAGFAPIALPLADDASIAQVHLELVAPTEAAAVWRGDDAVATQLTVDLTLAWSLAVGDSTTPLGTQRLAPMTLALALDGDDTAVDAAIAIAAPGVFWSWANLVELAELDLQVVAAAR